MSEPSPTNEPAPPGSRSEPSHAAKEARTWSMLIHIAAIPGFYLPGGSVVGPMALWFLTRSDSPIIDTQGKRAVNFQLTLLLLIVPLMVLEAPHLVIWCAKAFSVTMAVIAGLSVNRGQDYRYPWSIRFLS